MSSLAQAAHILPTRSDTILVRGAPRTLQVVDIPLASGRAEGRAHRFEILGEHGFTVVGPRSGTIAPGRRSMFITLAIPGGARAGRARAAVVRLTGDSGRVEERPIVVDVTRVRVTEIAGIGARIGVLRGEPVSIAFRVANRGNATDSLEVRVTPPHEWRGGDGSTLVEVDAGASLERAVRLTVPANSSTGSVAVVLAAIDGADTVARTTVFVEVADRDQRSRAGGPTLTIGTSVTRARGGEGGSSQFLSLRGQLSEAVAISAQGTVAPSSGATSFALSRIAYAPRTPQLALTGKDWHLELGSAGARFPDLAGASVFGRGASVAVQRTNWSLTSIVGRPDQFTGVTAGGFSGARLAARLGDVWLGTSGTHLEEQRSSIERLDAVAADVQVPLGRGAVLGAELAHRGYAGGAGLGWQARIRRQAPATSYEFRAVRAPGGTGAFASATEELSAFISQRLRSNVTLGASIWRLRDSTSTWSRFESDGWSLRPTLQLNHGLSLSIEGRRASSGAGGIAGEIGSDELSVDAQADLRVGRHFARAGVTAARVERAAVVDAGDPLNVRSMRQQARMDLGTAGALGRMELNLGVERGGYAMAASARQFSVGGRIEELPLLPGRRSVLGRASMQRLMLFGSNTATTALSAGLDAALPFGGRVSVELERNPFLVGLAGANPWIAGVRVERTLQLPRPWQAADEGVVFRDPDGDGHQGDEEPGVAGVVIRRGGETAVTDHDGRFRFPGARTGSLQLDARSLPIGLITPSSAAVGGANGEIGLVVVSTAEVHLALAEGADTRVAPAELAKVTLAARDSSGRAWVARVDRPGVMVFDALPPGRYQLEIDASASAEPLRVSGELPELRVVDGVAVAKTVVTLKARTLKVRQIPSADQTVRTPE
jgi:hypothetical protein